MTHDDIATRSNLTRSIGGALVAGSLLLSGTT